MTTAEIRLQMVIDLITAKKAELVNPAPVKKHGARPAGAPRALFMVMQRDLNRALTTEEVRKVKSSTWRELEALQRQQQDLIDEVAEEHRAIKASIDFGIDVTDQAAAAFKRVGEAFEQASIEITKFTKTKLVNGHG